MIFDQSTALSVFEYRDGVLFWKKNSKRAGTKHHTGYIQIGYLGKLYNAHRIIFLMYCGYLPTVIDHINGDRSDNRIENLRAASWTKNLQNMRLHPTNTSGVKNVSWCNTRKKWAVFVSIDGKRVNFGRYDDLELADLVATEARNKYHKSFARHA